MKINLINVSMLLVSLFFSSALCAQEEFPLKSGKRDFMITIGVKKSDDKKWVDIVQQYDRYALSNTNLNESFDYSRMEPDSNRSQFVFSVERPQIILVNLRPLYVEPGNPILLEFVYKGQDQYKVPIEMLTVKGKNGIFLVEDVNSYNATIVKERKIIFEKVMSKRFEIGYCISLLDSFAKSDVESLIKANTSYVFTEQRKAAFRGYFFERYYNNLLTVARTNSEKLVGLEKQVLDLNKRVSLLGTLKENQYFFSQKNIYQDFYRKKWQKNSFNLDILLKDLIGYNSLTKQYFLLLVLKNDIASLSTEQAKIQKIKGAIIDTNLSHYADKFLKARDKGFGYITNELRGLPVLNANLKQISFGDIFNDTQHPFLYLDFCGSWCAPCIAEIEKYASSSRSVDYSKKIRPVWLFFENNKNSWLDVIEKFHLRKENCFLITDSKLQQLFGKQFEWMGEFPHYFIFSKDGKIINSNAAPLTQLKGGKPPDNKGSHCPASSLLEL